MGQDCCAYNIVKWGQATDPSSNCGAVETVAHMYVCLQTLSLDDYRSSPHGQWSKWLVTSCIIYKDRLLPFWPNLSFLFHLLIRWQLAQGDFDITRTLGEPVEHESVFIWRIDLHKTLLIWKSCLKNCNLLIEVTNPSMQSATDKTRHLYCAHISIHWQCHFHSYCDQQCSHAYSGQLFTPRSNNSNTVKFKYSGIYLK